jgi:hypothetical protein
MPIKASIDAPGALHHIIVRGINGDWGRAEITDWKKNKNGPIAGLFKGNISFFGIKKRRIGLGTGSGRARLKDLLVDFKRKLRQYLIIGKERYANVETIWQERKGIIYRDMFGI